MKTQQHCPVGIHTAKNLTVKTTLVYYVSSSNIDSLRTFLVKPLIRYVLCYNIVKPFLLKSQPMFYMGWDFSKDGLKEWLKI